MDPGRLAVHRPAGAHDLPAVGGPDALMAKADAQNRNGGSGPPDQLGGDARLDRGAGTRGDDDPRGGKVQHLIDRQRVMTPDERGLAELLDIAREVVDEGVVVVDQEDHCLLYTSPSPQ